MDNIRRGIIRFSKAQFSAWIASTVDFGITIACAHVLGIWYAYATFIGAVSGGIVNCMINYRWVFHAFGRKKKSIALRYAIVWTVSIVFNTYGTYLLTEHTGLNFIVSKIIVSIVVAILWNYQMQYRFVFAQDEDINGK